MYILYSFIELYQIYFYAIMSIVKSSSYYLRLIEYIVIIRVGFFLLNI